MDKLAEFFPILAGVAIAFCFFVWLILFLVKLSTKKSPVITRYGKAIDKTPGAYDIIIVEFDNGQRERLVPSNRSIMITVGDKGIFKTQKNTIISFERQ